MGTPKSFQLAISLFAVVALQFTPFEEKAVSGDLPKYDHIVVVMMENHAFDQIFAPGSDAIYMRKLAKDGAVFSQSFGVTHPSQPNYLALFSGSTQGVCNDLNHDINAPNLATRLAANGKSFAGYIEAGSPRKHNPWESFTNVKGVEKPLTHFPTDFSKLPSVSFVIPNLRNDMHDGTIGQADAWLKDHLGHYASWAKNHDSLLIVTFDEDDRRSENRIPTLLYGSGIRVGVHSQTIDHYTMLRTIEDIEHLAPIGMSAHRAPISDAWHSPGSGQKRGIR
ncbi:alkaline phosphatase family protein [Rhizobium sp. RAF56]|jgi:acid phosphatase|uniref:alkaline phosphatase family protein n=1 Tax=Rhizobium sp. RAF56 TaxID=3233062 RepID=UPI003F9D6E5E